MKANAMYHRTITYDGRVTHAVAHDSGSFSVSSEKVGVAVQNFLNTATTTDMRVLHGHLLTAHHRAMKELEALPEEEEDDY